MDWRDNDGWRRRTEERYFGLTPGQFDLAIFAVIGGAALAVWLLVFGGAGVFGGGSSPGTSHPGVAVKQQSPAATTAASASPSPAADLYAMQPNEAIAESASHLAQDVQTLSGRFTMVTDMNDVKITSGATMQVQSPDKMYMVMDIAGKKLEVLAVLPDMYMHVPDEGWYKLSGNAFGMNPDAVQQYVKEHGLVDLGHQAKVLQNLSRQGNDQIDGTRYIHYAGTLTFAQMMADSPKGLFDPTAISRAENSMDPVHVEIWIDPKTSLPRRESTEFGVNANGFRVHFTSTFDFLEYNQPVSIPAPPGNAKPFNAIPQV